MNYILAILSASPLLGVAVRQKDGFNRLFSVFAFTFALAFYCIPLAFAAENNRLTYLGLGTPFYPDDRDSALLAMFLFSLGFLGCDFLVKSSKSLNEIDLRKRNRSKILSNIISVIIMLITAYLIYYLISTGYYEFTRTVRMKEAQASYLFTTFLLAMYYINCLMFIISLSKKAYFTSTIWFTLSFLLILNFGGRMQVGIVLLIPLVHIVRHHGLLIALGVVGGVVFLPLVLKGKEIIAAIAIGGDVFTIITNAYIDGFDVENVLNNFSHPLISYYYAPVLVDNIGYRYFWDIPQGFLFYLRLIGLDFGDSLTYYNTETIFFKRESIIPPGYLAFGYAQANLFGVAVMGAVFRLFGRAAQIVKQQIGEDAPAADFLLAFLAANTFYIGEMRGLVLTFIFPCVLMYIMVRLTKTDQDQASRKTRTSQSAAASGY